jgi:ABC-type transport system involved in multi-copper enzyme maturation permease subunit
MNARLIKETRDLLPMFAGTLPLIIVLQLIWPGAGYLALGVACVVMAGSSFGNEFQHRTISLLLSQPIARSVIWREKMLVLGTGMAASVAVLLGLAISDPVSEHVEWLPLALIPLCAFCGAPFWTLSLRQSIAGMVSTVGAPCGIVGVYALVVMQLGGNEPATLTPAVLSLLFIYCAVIYWLGYAKFKQLEAVDSPSRDLSLPAGLEAFFVAPLTKMSSRFRGPVAALLKKEFRLQQISFLLAGLFVLIAVAGGCFVRSHPEVAAGIIGGDIFIYVLILPLIAGAISVAEEKGWGMAEWHLTLPPSALKQWSAKMLAALSTSLVLGLLLPAAMFLVANPLFSQPSTRTSLPPAFEILNWVLGQLLVTSVAIYAASFSKNTLRAILVAFVILAAGVSAMVLMARGVELVAATLFQLLGRPHVEEGMMLSLLSGALALMLCLMQGFAWSNFRRSGPPALRLVFQFTVILAFVCQLSLTFFWVLHSQRGN